jgi:hypothetical protein
MTDASGKNRNDFIPYKLFIDQQRWDYKVKKEIKDIHE